MVQPAIQSQFFNTLNFPLFLLVKYGEPTIKSQLYSRGAMGAATERQLHWRPRRWEEGGNMEIEWKSWEDMGKYREIPLKWRF